MYTKSAVYYDLIYADKNYAAEAEQIHSLIWQYRRSAGRKLVDVACGTGRHLEHLQQHYFVSGIDLNAELLRQAHDRCPEVEFYNADMASFELGFQVDVVICLFSAIGYAKTAKQLNKVLATMHRHLKPGGVIIVEPWFTPENWHAGRISSRFVEQSDLRLARMSVSATKNDIAISEQHFMVATPNGVTYFKELHELGLFTHQQYLEAFSRRGMIVHFDPEGLTGRGIYIGVKPLS